MHVEKHRAHCFQSIELCINCYAWWWPHHAEGWLCYHLYQLMVDGKKLGHSWVSNKTKIANIHPNWIWNLIWRFLTEINKYGIWHSRRQFWNWKQHFIYLKCAVLFYPDLNYLSCEFPANLASHKFSFTFFFFFIREMMRCYLISLKVGKSSLS